MRRVYDIATRRRLAVELVDAFCEPGPWTAADLAERGAGRLDPRPEWIDALGAQLERGGRPRPENGRELSLAAERRLVREIEAFLVSWTSVHRAVALARASAERAPEHRAVAEGAAMGEAAAGGAAAGEGPAPRLVRGEPARPSYRWPVLELDSVGDLAERLELSAGQLEWLADVRGLERDVAREALRNYRYRWIPRRSGPPRLIEAPKLRLKEVQRIILREILAAVPVHDAACGFVPGRSVLDHAARHVGRPAVLRMDLRDFFASVPAARAFGIFHVIGYPAPVAHALTGLTTNTTARIAREAMPTGPEQAASGLRFTLERRLATPHLPQGAPTSPALANLAAHGLDRRLSAFAEACELRYSRYADDIALSGAPLRRGARAREVQAAVAAIVREEGFALHSGKSRLRTAARRQLLTGIVVNEHPNVARDDYDRLRATLHRAARDGPGAVAIAGPRAGGAALDVRAHLNGRVAWVEAVNPRRGARLRRAFDAIEWDGAA